MSHNPTTNVTAVHPFEIKALNVVVQAIEEFAAVEEAGAEALLGDSTNNLIPEGSDVMVYGDGGTGKTTLTIDMSCHLGAGCDWLGMRIQKPVRVLIIEAEGPRPLLRRKLRRKLEAWDGPPAAGRVQVLTSPWADFTFASEQWRDELAQIVEEQEIDVILAGPLARIGMDGAGTLQEVVSFMRLITDVRARCNRRVTLILVHHENKGGAVSGAWEGAADTLLHIQDAGHGHTLVHIAKARWASDYHGKTLRLNWAPGESFEIEDDRDLHHEMTNLLGDGTWRTVDQIRQGVKAGTQAVRDVLKEHADDFEMLTGEAARDLGRSPNSHLYATAQVTRLMPESSPVETTLEGVYGNPLDSRPTLIRVESRSGVVPMTPKPNSTPNREWSKP
jgi:hypothetical protein